MISYPEHTRTPPVIDGHITVFFSDSHPYYTSLLSLQDKEREGRGERGERVVVVVVGFPVAVTAWCSADVACDVPADVLVSASGSQSNDDEDDAHEGFPIWQGLE